VTQSFVARLWLLGSLLVAGCGEEGVGTWDAVRASGRPIYYGEPDASEAHRAVVAITNGPGQGYFCSGTLITDNVVLTAGHCLQGAWPSGTEVFFGRDAYSGVGHYVEADALLVHPDYDD